MNLGLCKERKYAYSLVYPLNIKYHAIFHFPQEMFIDDENKVLLDNDFFYLKEELQQLSTNSLRIDYTYKVKKKFIGVEEFKNVCNEVNKVINKLPHVIYFEK
jgi:phenolic acid decarboxylase